MAIRIGIVGAGFMGQTHATCYRQMPNVSVAAVSDVRPAHAERIAQESGAVVYQGLDDLLDMGDVDAIDLCLPTDLHEQAVRAVAGRGKHCLVEKPLTLDPAGSKRIVEVVRRSGIIFMVAHVLRFWPEYQFLEDGVRQDRWGRLLSLLLIRLSSCPSWTWNNWNLDGGRSGGALLDLHIHDTDFVRLLLGEPLGVDSCGVKVHGAWDYVATNYHYPGIAVSAIGGWSLPAGMPLQWGYRAIFEKVALDFDGARDPALLLHEPGGTARTPHVLRPNIGSADSGGNISALDGYYNELKYFVECVEKGEEATRSGVEDAARSVEWVYREMASAEQNLRQRP